MLTIIPMEIQPPKSRDPQFVREPEPDDFIQKTPHFLQDDSLFIMYLSS